MPNEHQPSGVAESDALGILIERSGIKRACDLDLMVFFGRHPRSLLSTDSLAAFLGYDIKQIAQSLDLMLAAGVLRRKQTTAHAARLYELIVGEPASGEWLEELLAQASTRPGRQALLAEIDRRAGEQPPEVDGSSDVSPGPRRIIAHQRIS